MDPSHMNHAPTTAIGEFFSQNGFMPHGHCYLWKPELLGIHLVSDLLIGSAYVGIAMSLYFIIKRIEIQFSAVVLAFGTFIGACGGTHFIEAWNLWHTDYWISGWVKGITAFASVITGIWLVKLRPQIFEVAEAAKLADQQRLDLKALTESLERRVDERTHELNQSRLEAQLGEAQLRVVTNALPSLISSVDPDHRYVMANATYYKWFEIEGSIEGKHMREVVGDDAYAMITPLLEKAFSGEAVVFERELNYSSGPRWVRASYSPVKNAAGEVELVIAMVNDLSERRQAELEREKLLQAESTARAQAELERQKIESLFNQVPAAIAILSGPEHVISYANPEYRAGLGREIIGKSYADAVPEAGPQGVIALLDHVYDSETAWANPEFPLNLKQEDGSEKTLYLSSILQPLKGINGEIEGIMNFSTDVTPQVIAKHQAEESERRLNLALNAANMGTWDWDILTNKVNWDARTERLFGFSPGEFKGELSQVTAHMAPGDAERMWIEAAKAFSDKTEYSMEFHIRWPDGSEHWLLSRGAAIQSHDGQATKMVGTVVDITARKHAENELAEAKERAEVANRAKSEFLANMSHEIRTPLGAMLGFAQLMLEEQASPAEQQSHLRTILRNGEQLYRIINEILDLSKVEANKIEIEKSRFALAEVIHDVTSLLAIKFTEKGRVDALFRFREKPSSGDSPLLEITVSDTGSGIPADRLKRLFQPFSQADSATSRKFGGTGLGLYLSKRLAQALGGDLVLKECVEDTGCIFVITVETGQQETKSFVPLKSPGEADLSRDDFKKTAMESLHGVKVLVVDDSPDNLHLTHRFLNAAGASVETASSAAKAFEILNHHAFNVIIMDIQMPEIDGYEAVRKLRKEGYTKPVIALTAHAMKGERERCLDAGFDWYLNKPIDRQALLKSIRSYADRRMT